MAKTETGRSIVPDIVNAGDDESIRSPRNNVGIGKLPSGGTIFTSTYVHSNEDDLEGAEEEVYNDRISGNGKDINPSDVGVPKPIERCQQRLATFDKKKCRENVRVCEKVCKDKGRSCYNALPSPPQCPKLACSVDMMSKLPNWLLFFFIHNEPKDINFKDFVKKDEASFHLSDAAPGNGVVAAGSSAAAAAVEVGVGGSEGLKGVGLALGTKQAAGLLQAAPAQGTGGRRQSLAPPGGGRGRGRGRHRLPCRLAHRVAHVGGHWRRLAYGDGPLGRSAAHLGLGSLARRQHRRLQRTAGP